MFERILERMRRLVREGQYVMTVHGVEAMEDDELTVFDVERCLLRGSIVERQRDRRPDAPAGDPDRISHRG